MSGVTEWVINGNMRTTEEGLFLVFFYICLVFSTGEKIVLIKYSGNCIIGNKSSVNPGILLEGMKLSWASFE